MKQVLDVIVMELAHTCATDIKSNELHFLVVRMIHVIHTGTVTKIAPTGEIILDPGNKIVVMTFRITNHVVDKKKDGRQQTYY